MGVGVTQPDPITAMRAVLRILDAEVVDSKLTDEEGREQKQFETELKVLSGAGERNGETFPQWFTFSARGKIGPNTKTGQLLTAALGKDDAQAETLEELARRLLDKTFAAQIGLSKNGRYPNIVHDTIVPASEPEPAEGNDDGEDPEEEFERIPF